MTPPTWVCCARPPSCGGKPCGHLNTGPGLYFSGRLCCQKCGCTFAASQARAAKLAPQREREQLSPAQHRAFWDGVEADHAEQRPENTSPNYARDHNKGARGDA